MAQTVIDFQAELQSAYVLAAKLRPAYESYLEISTRIAWLERQVQGLNEAREKYELGQLPKKVRKNSPKSTEVRAEEAMMARFKALAPEQKIFLESLMKKK